MFNDAWFWIAVMFFVAAWYWFFLFLGFRGAVKKRYQSFQKLHEAVGDVIYWLTAFHDHPDDEDNWNAIFDADGCLADLRSAFEKLDD
jgi:hypothetical protein